MTNIVNHCQKLRNYGDLRTDFQKFIELASNKKVAKMCNSIVNQPLSDESDDITAFEKYPIPELHPMQFSVNVFGMALLRCL